MNLDWKIGKWQQRDIEVLRDFEEIQYSPCSCIALSAMVYSRVVLPAMQNMHNHHPTKVIITLLEDYKSGAYVTQLLITPDPLILCYSHING